MNIFSPGVVADRQFSPHLRDLCGLLCIVFTAVAAPCDGNDRDGSGTEELKELTDFPNVIRGNVRNRDPMNRGQNRFRSPKRQVERQE
jgi:hypothetical protein